MIMKIKFIGRKKEIELVLSAINRKRSVLIIGKKGIGKTEFLKNISSKGIYCSSMPTRQLLLDIMFSMKIDKKGLSNTKLMLDEILKHNRKVLFIDDIDFANKNSISIINNLKNEGFVIVSAGIKEPKNIDFFEKIELTALSFSESVLMIKSNYKLPDSIVSAIARISGGVPREIIDNSNDAKNSIESGFLDEKNKNEINNYINELENKQRRSVLLSASFLLPFAYFMLSLRYILYFQKNYKAGYLTATAAYLIFAFFRNRRK